MTTCEPDGWVEQIKAAVAEAMRQRYCPPRATYRLQFHREYMTFRDAAQLVPYLHGLGVSHVYASPLMKACPGSVHGYDIVDHRCLNPELGTDDDFAAFIAELKRHGMGLLLDIVPNHMGIATEENAWWHDVLENGPSSPYARFFDIDWQPVKAELENKVLLPLLGGQYGEVLEAGRLRVEYHEGAFCLRYYQRCLPLDPRSYAFILKLRLPALKEALGNDSADLRELESILTALEYLPTTAETAPDRVAERQREKEVIKERLRRWTAVSSAAAAFIEETLQELNGKVGEPQSFDRLDELLNAQVYRLAHWKAAAEEVNYRRFFDINDLAAVCTEEPQVFDYAHQFIFELLVRGDVSGLRVDHIDGLLDPLEYLRRLQSGYLRTLARKVFEQLRAENTTAGGGANADAKPSGETSAGVPPWDILEPVLMQALSETDFPRLPVYVVVEKILGPDEPLPPSWPAAGTTGYDFLNLVNRLFVDREGFRKMVNTYQRFTDDYSDFAEVVYQAKLLILRVAMSSELQLLAHRLNRISERHRRSRDFTLNSLRIALREILTCFPVYRTYIREGRISDRDRQMVHRAVVQAKRRNPARDAAVFDFVGDVLLLEQPPNLDEAGRRERELFVGRFQQVTSPLVAKGVEDTAFYVYLPLISLNEVGGDPTKGGGSVAEFHHENRERLAAWPESLVTTTTHDTKRSEDVRSRINVLAEMPDRWRKTVNRWARLNRRFRREVDGLPAPSPHDEYLFYQTLVGVWPLEAIAGPLPEQFIARLQTYMEKAAREAKRRSSWINPNVDYEAAVREFVASALEERPRNRFLTEVRTFLEHTVDWGLFYALAKTLLKLTVPGVPDIYQGQELWEFQLVDPDNRRPADFALRRRLLAELEAAYSQDDDARLRFVRDLAAHPRDSRLKLLVTWRALQFRRRHAALFKSGRYEVLTAEGAGAEHICAFAWRRPKEDIAGQEAAIVVVPRLLIRLAALAQEGPPVARPPLGGDVWGDTQLNIAPLPASPWKNIFTGRTCTPHDDRLSLADVFADFPVALLSNVE